MIDAIKRMLAGEAPAPGTGSADPASEDGVRVAACALLLEVANADGEFSDQERALVEEALTRHFDLAPDAAHQLMAYAAARQREAVDLHDFTSRIAEHYDEGQRMTLAEVLWRVVYADGKLSEHEDYLMRKLGRLLDLRPGYLNAARSRVTPPKPE